MAAAQVHRHPEKLRSVRADMCSTIWLAWAGRSVLWLAGRSSPTHVGAMFSVDETTARTIRQVFEDKGELSAVVELRRHFPGITDNENARRCVRAIASWTPLPPQPEQTSRRKGPTRT